jgi:beta-phosphoglucomutase-like phosphatase (HAD superfamily)
MAALEAIIFDVDGTLADTERHGHRIAFNRAFEQFNLDWSWDETLYGALLATTGGKERIKSYLRDYRSGETVDDDFIATLHQTKTRFYLEMLQTEGIPLRDGVRELITAAREANILLAIATTTTYENISNLLIQELGTESIHWFTPLAAGDIVPHKKPAPDIYHYVLEHSKLNPEHCIAIEDSYNGIQSSLGAGITTVITTNGYTEHEDFQGAALVVDKLGTHDNPFRVQAGNAHGHTHVTLDLLQTLLS